MEDEKHERLVFLLEVDPSTSWQMNKQSHGTKMTNYFLCQTHHFSFNARVKVKNHSPAPFLLSLWSTQNL